MPILLVAISTVLAFLNYLPHTFLSGWDTLHPEFNLLLNLQRVFFGVWRPDQGLGAVAGHSHMSELPRLFILFLFSTVFSMDFLRYAYMFLCLIIGPIGIYFFLKKIVLQKYPRTIQMLAAFVGAAFYLCNLGTLQTFYVPFEMFPTQFAFLGWIFLFAFLYLQMPRKKYLALFLATLFFASPMAYAAQLWYAFFLIFSIIILGYGFLKSRKTVKSGLILVLLTLCVNAYWLLPNLYYVKNYASVPEQAKENRIYSDEYFAQNQKYGTFLDTALLKNFYFNWTQYNPTTHQVVSLMPQWNKYVNQLPIQLIGYLFFAGSCIGLFLLIKQQRAIGIPFAISGIISFIVIANNIPILNLPLIFIRDHVPLVREALRFPFDKLVLLLLFCYVVFFTTFLATILRSLISKLPHRRYTYIRLVFPTLCTVLLLIYIFPAFQGQFIDPFMKIKIPSDYFAMNNWLSEQNPDTRILKLPLNNYTGWVYYDWGYQGAGFNWFGIPQATLDRDSDRWSVYNEESYREFSYALYSKNDTLFEKLLQKYHIGYVLVDTSVASPGDKDKKALFFPQSFSLLDKINSLHKAKTFGSHLTVYEYASEANAQPVSFLHTTKNITPPLLWTNLDEAYMQQGNYITEPDYPQSLQTTFYPERLFLTPTDTVDTHLLNLNGDAYTIKIQLPQQQQGYITIPGVTNNQQNYYAHVSASTKNQQSTIQVEYLLPSTGYDNNYQKTFNLQTNQSLFSINDYAFSLPTQFSSSSLALKDIPIHANEENTFRIYTPTPQTLSVAKTLKPDVHVCGPLYKSPSFGLNQFDKGFEIYNSNASLCVDLPLQQMLTNMTDISQMVKISFRYTLGQSNTALVCFLNTKTNQCLNQDTLSPKGNVYEGVVAVNPSNASSLALRVMLENNQSNFPQLTTMSHFTATSYAAIHTENFSNIFPSYSLFTNTISLQGVLPSPLEIPLTDLLAQKKDCSFDGTQTIIKRLLTSPHQAPVLQYNTLNGVNCDDANLPELPHNSDYILDINSKHEKGLPLRICLQDSMQQRCVLEENLPLSNTFTHTKFLIPAQDTGYGYTLLISNIAINGPSINDIQSINITPFPNNIFQAITWTSSSLVTKQKTNQKSYISLLASSPTAYGFSMKHATTADILTLNQAYETNWKLYQVPSFIAHTTFLQYLAPLLGKGVSGHVLVNNWQNGWKLPVNNNETYYVLIFLPQYLEFGGLIVLIGSFIGIIVFPLRSYKSKVRHSYLVSHILEALEEKKTLRP